MKEIYDLAGWFENAEKERQKLTNYWMKVTMGLLNDEKVDGEYVHHIYCNASRQEPVGNSICCCPIGRRIKMLKFELKKATLPILVVDNSIV